MCGIAGIVALRSGPVEDKSVRRLTELLAHRGPDGTGSWFSADRCVGLGHTRLAILDPGEGGRQPMVSADGHHVIVYNGEIYNFLELRSELEAQGKRFLTESDTEVILAAWQHWGASMLARFNGMWAFCIYDVHTKELFLARDRFGIKPLLYSMTPERFVFASEMRAMLNSGLVPRTLDGEVARRLVLEPFGVEGSARTLFSSVQRLQGGHYLRLRDGRAEIKRWWCTVDHLPAVPRNEESYVAEFGSLFRDAVALRMRSDVPIGTSLSGGFDSTAILCTMASIEKAGMGPRGARVWRPAFVASFPGMAIDERVDAESAAAWAGVTPTVVKLGREDALKDIDRVLEDLDEIYIGLPTAAWRVYRESRRQGVIVCLDGNGADELIGAYKQEGDGWSFLLRNFISRLATSGPALSRGVDVARALALMQRGHYFLRDGLAELPPQLPVVGTGDSLPKHWGALNRRLYQMFHGNVLPTILRNFDRLSMAHGIEVRMPFLDWRLVTYSMALPDKSKKRNGCTKMVARRAMAQRMPESIRTGVRKVGFNSPMPDWLNGPLAGWVNSLLRRPVPAFDDLIDVRELNGAVSRLAERQAWDWVSAGRIWPYLHLKWMLARYV